MQDEVAERGIAGHQLPEAVSGYRDYLARVERYRGVVGGLSGQQAELAEEAAVAVHADDTLLRRPAAFDDSHVPGEDHEEVAVPVALGEQDLLRLRAAALAQRGEDADLGVTQPGIRPLEIGGLRSRPGRVRSRPGLLVGAAVEIRRRHCRHSTSASPRPARTTGRSGARRRRRERERAGAAKSRSSRPFRRSSTGADAPTGSPGAGIPRSPLASAVTPGGPGSGVDQVIQTCSPFASAAQIPQGSRRSSDRTSADQLVLRLVAPGGRRSTWLGDVGLPPRPPHRKRRCSDETTDSDRDGSDSRDRHGDRCRECGQHQPLSGRPVCDNVVPTSANTSPEVVRSLIPARVDRLPWSPFHTRMVIALGVAWVLDGLERSRSRARWRST